MWGLSGICIGCVFLCPKICDLFIQKMHSDWISWVISHDHDDKSVQRWMWWRKLEGSALFSKSLTLHEDILLWRIQCIFLRHGFLLIKEIILLPCLFCEFWKQEVRHSYIGFFCCFLFFSKLETISYMQLKDFISRGEKKSAWILWKMCKFMKSLLKLWVWPWTQRENSAPVVDLGHSML